MNLLESRERKGKDMAKYFSGVYCIILFFFGPILCAWEPPLSIRSIMVKNYGVNDFTRISEYFTGRESTGGDTILRTDPSGRAGIYLVIKLSQPLCRLAEDAVLTFRYVLSDCNRETEQTFELASVAGSSRWLFVGVTGADYHGAAQSLMAWSVEIASNGECVAQESYLWRMRQPLQVEPVESKEVYCSLPKS